MVKLKDIAERLNVSTCTVSMALNDSPRVSRETIERVKAAAQTMGYRPNSIGRSLRTGKSMLIGCITVPFTVSFFAELAQAIGEKLTRHGYGMLNTWENDQSEDWLIRQLDFLLDRNIDGLVFMGGAGLMLENFVRKIRNSGIPFVFCSQNCEQEGYPFVVTDDLLGGRMAAEYLLKMGHRKILCEFSRQVDLRLRGNLSAINAFPGAQSSVFYELDELPTLLKNIQATAIISYSDETAIQTLRLLRANGFRVPEDVSLIGYDGSDLSGLPEFNLTTIVQQRQELGYAAVEYLFQCLAGKSVPSSRLLKPELKCRGTVRNLN